MKSALVVLAFFLSTFCALNYLFWSELTSALWILLSTLIFADILYSLFVFKVYSRISFAFFFFKIFYFTLIILEPTLSIIWFGEFSYVKQFGVYNLASIKLVLLFHSVFYLVNLLAERKYILPKAFLQPMLGWKNVFLLILFNVIGLYPYFRDGIQGFILIILRGRSSGNSQFDNSGLGNSDLLIHLSTILISVACICGYYLLSTRKRGFWISFVLVLIFLVNLAIVASSGTRTRVIFILLPIIVFYCYTLAIEFRKFSSTVALGFAALSLGLLSLMAQFRTTGYENMTETSEFRADFSGINLNNEFIYIVDNFYRPVDKRNVFETFIYPIPEQIWKFITNPIPRIIYPQKYIDPSFAEFNMKRIGLSGTAATFNITPTIFGRFYLLYGILGLFYIPVFITLPLMTLDYSIRGRTTRTDSIFIYMIFITFICQSLRDLSPGWIYSAVVAIIIFGLNKRL